MGTIGQLASELSRTAYFAIFFVVGSFVALNLVTIRRLLTRTAPFGGVTCLVTGLLVIQAHWTRIHPAQAMMVAVGSALVIVGALAPGRIETVLSHSWLRFLGRISYSVYLVHVPLILSVVLLLDGRVPLAPVLIGVPPVAVLLGWLFHEAVAEPCVRLGQRLAARFTLRPANLPIGLDPQITS